MAKIGVIGYGYVGKALADRLSNFYDVICYEKDERKIVFSKDNPKLLLTNESNSLVECDIFIVTVQTPIDDKGNPDLKFIIESTELVAKYLSKGNIIVYESTVYPGVTEGICGKLIEKNAGLELNKDFYLGYSPERISPGDKNHTITNIAKIISASNSSALKIIKEVYSKVTQEIFVANSIMEAEAAKLLENLQRDVNIALMNEYLSVMQKLGINIRNVIDAANSKWNFNYYLPGFVGGHCIGIDTHYYIKVAQDVGITPKIAKISRMINEEAILNISNLIIEHVDKLKNKRICVLGITYKDNIDDLRNSASLKVVNKLKNQGYEVLIFDPLLRKDAAHDANIDLCSFEEIDDISALVCLVYHDVFDEFEFDSTIFENPDEAMVIDPNCKLIKLRNYNKFII